MDQQFTRRIVLLGKTGTGKSSLCNTLFGEKVFKESSSANSVTRLCQSFTKTIDGRNIQLINTPSLFDTDISNDELKSELLRSIMESAPGPHAFLLVFKIETFTKQEEEIVNLMVNEYFGEEALKYTTVVFTHGDQLPEGMKIEEWMKEFKPLKNLLEKCQNRCCVFDNKYWNDSRDLYRNNKIQIKKLLEIIDQTVRENREDHYTNEMLKEVQKQIEEKKDQLRRSSPNMSEQSLFTWAKESVYNYMKGLGIGAILGALLGGAAGAVLGMEFFVGSGAAVGGAVGGAVGLAVGAVLGYMYDVKKKKSKQYKPIRNTV